MAEDTTAEPCAPGKSPTQEQEKHASPPPRPDPSNDAGILRLSPGHPEQSVNPQDIDIYSLSSVAALKLLCAGVECLVRMTGDIPPTPPIEKVEAAAWRNMRGMQAEKENIVRTTSQTNLMNLSVLGTNHPTPKTSTAEVTSPSTLR